MLPAPKQLSQDVRCEVFTAVTMKNAVFWVVTVCVALVRTDVSEQRLACHQGDKNWRARNNVSSN
jgi:hypothetical protein